MGFPFLAGYYSKDLIIEWRMSGVLSVTITVVLVFSTIITLVYSYRIIKFLYRGRRWGRSLCLEKGGDWWLDLSIIVISCYVLVRGRMIRWGLLFPYPHPIIRVGEKFFLFESFICVLLLMSLFDHCLLRLIKIVRGQFNYSM